MLTLVRTFLETDGHEVTTASGGPEALEILKKETFAVIISDAKMPQMTGMQFLAQAKLMQPDASRILITAYVELDTILEAINRGEIYRFVSKPFIREEFLATVRTAVQRYALIRQNEELHEATRSMNQQLTEVNRILHEQIARSASRTFNSSRSTAASNTIWKGRLSFASGRWRCSTPCWAGRRAARTRCAMPWRRCSICQRIRSALWASRRGCTTSGSWACRGR